MTEKKNLARKIIETSLIVGFLDGLAAVLQTLLYRGNPVRVFNYIASSLLGHEALNEGYSVALLGLLLHFLIAFIWTLIFFLIYPRIKLLSKSPLLTGIGYGIVVWIGMNLVVLPLTKISSTFSFRGTTISGTILIIAFGIPLSFITYWYYQKDK